MEQPCAEIVHVGRDGGLMFSEQPSAEYARTFGEMLILLARGQLFAEIVHVGCLNLWLNPNFVARSRTT